MQVAFGFPQNPAPCTLCNTRCTTLVHVVQQSVHGGETGSPVMASNAQKPQKERKEKSTPLGVMTGASVPRSGSRAFPQTLMAILKAYTDQQEAGHVQVSSL